MPAVGMLFQAWLIGNVTKAIGQATQVEDDHQLLMARLQDFMKAKYMPHDLCQEVLTYQQKKFESDRNFSIHEFVRCVGVAQVAVQVYVPVLQSDASFPIRQNAAPQTRVRNVTGALHQKARPVPMFYRASTARHD